MVHKSVPQIIDGTIIIFQITYEYSQWCQTIGMSNMWKKSPVPEITYENSQWCKTIPM